MQPDSKRRKCSDETKKVGEPDSTLQLNVSLPSGRCAAVSGLRSGDSITAVAQKLKGTATKDALAYGGRSIKEATVRLSKISSTTFSRSMRQRALLLQSWQMEAL